MRKYVALGLLTVILLAAALLFVHTVHADEVLPPGDPVSATLVANCQGLAMILVLTYKDGSVVRAMKNHMYGFKTWEELLAYGDKAGANALRFDELCDGLDT